MQIGDPFEESKLIECCLELVDSELLVSLQDLGAAGLSSSTSEMAAKGGVGIDLDVAQVPLREADMEPFEIMISESQERMLCVVEPPQLAAVLAVCERWETRATPIGDRHRQRGACGCSKARSWSATCRCPRSSTSARSTTSTRRSRRTGSSSSRPRAPGSRRTPTRSATLRALLGSENVASRRWVFEQYDSLVGSRTVRRPAQADAAVLRLALGDVTTERALAISIDGNGRRVACDPYVGAAEAVAECAANLACVGAAPLGLTNCLNFGNPEKPHVAWQLTRAVEGMAAACRAFGVPVVGGNVSLYNEGPEGPIYPTPVVGMVGELPDAARAGGLAFGRPRRHGRAGRPVRALAAWLGARAPGGHGRGPAGAVRPEEGARGLGARARRRAGGGA